MLIQTKNKPRGSTTCSHSDPKTDQHNLTTTRNLSLRLFSHVGIQNQFKNLQSLQQKILLVQQICSSNPFVLLTQNNQETQGIRQKNMIPSDTSFLSKALPVLILTWMAT